MEIGSHVRILAWSYGHQMLFAIVNGLGMNEGDVIVEAIVPNTLWSLLSSSGS